MMYYGRKRDHYDPRDLIYVPPSHLLMGGPAPSSFDTHTGLSAPMPPIFNQVQESSCTANAGIRWYSWLTLKFPAYAPATLVPLSRQAQYYWERALPWNNTTSQDDGANSRDIFYVLNTIGTCPETDDPYTPATIFTQPSQQALTDAKLRTIGAYHRLTSLDDIKGCLLSGYSFTMGFQVFESFEDIGGDGIWAPNVSKEQVVGGHEVYGHGFDDSVNGGSLIFDNSWGTDWGKDGEFYMPYSFVLDYNNSQWDGWVGHFGPPWRAK